MSLQRELVIKLIKEGGWVFLGQVGAILGSVLLVRVLTEYLDPAEYGDLSLGLTIAVLMNQVVTGGITSGISRFYSIALEKNDIVRYLHASKRLLIHTTSIIILTTITLSLCLFWIDLHRWVGLIVVTSMFSIVSSYSGALSGILNAARLRSVVAIYSCFDSWLKIAMAIAVVVSLGASSSSVVIGYLISALLISILQLLSLLRHVRKQGAVLNNESRENWHKKIVEFGWPFSIWGIFTWAQLVSDRWALESFSSTLDVGKYTVLLQIGYTPINILTGMVITFISPIIYQRSGAGKNKIRDEDVLSITFKIAGICLLVTIFSVLLASKFHAQLFEVLVAASYRNTSHYLPWMVLSGGLFATGQILSLKVMSELNTRLLISVKLVTALLGLALNFVGAWKFGISGVIGASVIFSLIYLLWVAFVCTHQKAKYNLNL